MSMNDRITVKDVINSEFINDRTMIYIDLNIIWPDESIWIYTHGTWFSDRILDCLHDEVMEYTYSAKENGLLIKAIRRFDHCRYCFNREEA